MSISNDMLQNYLLVLSYPLLVVLCLLMVSKKVKYTRLTLIKRVVQLAAVSGGILLIAYILGQMDSEPSDYLVIFLGIPTVILIIVPLILCLSILPVLYIGYRLNDIGISHWFGLICIIPPTIIMVIFILCFIPGKMQTSNPQINVPA